MAQRQEPVGHFEISVKSALGAMSRVGVSVLVVPSGKTVPGGVIHVLQAAPEALTRVRPANGLDADRFGLLTPREEEVLHLMADGRSTAEIAEELFIGAATVRHHVQGILSKLGVHSRLGAVVAFHHGQSGRQ